MWKIIPKYLTGKEETWSLYAAVAAYAMNTFASVEVQNCWSGIMGVGLLLMHHVH